MSFLGKLANQIDTSLGLGENSNRTLDSVVNGTNIKYGSLGDFAKKFDQSAERRYVEEGYLRRDPFNTDPKQFELLLQEPKATVLIKKKMFSSIAENFRPDYMDEDEKLYYKAIKVLFANKCAQISALEKLSKIQSVTAGAGAVSDTLLPIIITAMDVIESGGISSGNTNVAFGSNPILKSDASKLINISNQLRKMYSFNVANPTTTWLSDSSNLFQSQFGAGTGVIEITNFNSISTNVSVDGIKQPGSFSISIEDPYEAMLITEWDIEKAIADATNMFKNSSVFQIVGEQGSDLIINNNQTALNQIRAARGASPITIKINPNTLLGRRVTAILDRSGIELKFDYNSSLGLSAFSSSGGVDVADEYLRGGDVAGEDGLDNNSVSTKFPGTIALSFKDFAKKNTSELQAFQTLISSIYTKIQLEQNSQNAFQITNVATNYARRKMRFNFSGKLIIQPMDIVHVYLNSKSSFDNKLLGGLKNMSNSFNFTQTLNSAATNINNITSLLNPSNSGSIQAEKAAYVGSSFPDSLWVALRSQFINENEGTHVFAGVVDAAPSSWDAGKFMVNVTGRDNTVYFDQGKVNFKPGVDVFNGAIYDPLTPFKSNFSSITSNANNNGKELLDENKALLGTELDKNGLVKSKSGPNAGKKIASDHFITDIVVDPATGFKSRVLHAPDGLVYKWKEGIGVFTQVGSSLVLNNPDKTGTPTAFQEPFAGQDIMNVISLLITGQPYNYSNFWRASNNLHAFGKDHQTQQDAAHNYIAALKNELTKSNILWGNFIPFKNLVIDEKSFALAQNSQFRIINKNRDIEAKLGKLKDLNNQAAIFGAANTLTNIPKIFTPQFESVKSQVTELQKSIQSDIDSMAKEEQQYGMNFGSAGSDATYDYSDFIDSSKIGIAPSNPNLKRELRRQINYLTRRMSYNVRANEDKNLFIVDDSYDKDYDILAYNKSLDNGIKLFANNFNSTREHIKNTADLLNLEVFADTQGHIRVRPPQYNRMPSSVFYRMMYLKQAYGIQVFPEFLNDLFVNQIDSLRKRVEVLDDLIRLDCAIILGTNVGGQSSDDSAKEYIISGGSYNLDSHNTGAAFDFISDPSGVIVDINQLLSSADPSATSQIVPITDALEKQATSTKDVFNNTSRYTAIISKLSQQNLSEQGYSLNNVPTFNANSYVDQLISRIQTKSGERINKSDYVQNSVEDNGLVLNTTATIDIFKITKELQEKLKERQKVIRLFYSILSNAKEFRSLDGENSDVSNQLVAPAIYGNSEVPEVFEHMIEDESYNDYGTNSGSRFIIKRAQIKNINIVENPPDFTLVEVQGLIDPFNPPLNAELNIFPAGGNALVTAAAVDYDMWRNYGFKNQAPIIVPFLKDPESQCAPYASMILSRARKNILRGTITIMGNEYMQPGEVVYLEDRGLLFYVNTVRHNFVFNTAFTTTLDVSYGHTPGEYIPTTMDIIGKMLYNNKDVADYTIQRQSSSADESSIGIVQMESNGSIIPNAQTSNASGLPNPAQNSVSSANKQSLDNIMFHAAYLINANNTKGNNVVANVELRIYLDNANPIKSSLKEFAQNVKNILTGKITGTISVGTAATATLNPAIPEKNVKIVEVNLDDQSSNKSPSQKAIDAARNNVANNKNTITLDSNDSTASSTASNDKLRAALFGLIVDCWISFATVPAQSTGGN